MKKQTKQKITWTQETGYKWELNAQETDEQVTTAGIIDHRKPGVEELRKPNSRGLRTIIGGDVKQNKLETELRPGRKDKHMYRTEVRQN